MCHGIAAILSGGKLAAIQISSNLGGVCYTEKGNQFIIASAGYIGSLLFGVILFISGYKKDWSKWIGIAVSVLFIIFTANYIIGLTGRIAGISIAMIFLIIPNLFPETINAFFMKILGLISILYVIIDIKQDLFTLHYRPSDAQILSEITSIPALFWGISWFLISLVTVIYLLRWGISKGFKIK